MVRAIKLKVYRTSIGFHDAYVAAPSQKSALEAWGSDKNLFARGVAEIVTDEKLVAEPLASPGKVVKRLRGTTAEQMAALPPDKPTTAKTAQSDVRTKEVRAQFRKPAPQRLPVPPPSRSALEKAESALEDIERRERSMIDDLDRRQAELAKERRQATTAFVKEKEQLARRQREEADKYDRAIRRWKGD